jgi:hypothetical protein
MSITFAGRLAEAGDVATVEDVQDAFDDA